MIKRPAFRKLAKLLEMKQGMKLVKDAGTADRAAGAGLLRQRSVAPAGSGPF